jgi:hypothetical protein
MNRHRLLLQRTIPWIFGVTLMTGAGLTLAGLLRQKWPDVLPSGGLRPLVGYVGFMLGCAVIVSLGGRLTSRRPLTITVLLGLFIAACAGAVWPLLVTLVYAVSAMALGHAALTTLGGADKQSDPVTRLLVGAGIYGTLVSLSAHVPVNYPGVYFLALLAPIFFARRWLWDDMSRLAAMLFRSPAQAVRIDWPEVLLGAVALVHFAFALLPEVMFDTLSLHLFVPAHMAARHEWGFNPSLYSLALVPMLGDWNFSIGYILAGETGARLINLGCTYLIAYLGRELVMWAGGNEKGGTWAMLLFLATPLTFTESSSLFVESVWTAYLIAGLLWLLRAVTDEEFRAPGVVLSGFMLGLAAAAKAVTLTYLPALVLPLLVIAPRWRTLRMPQMRTAIALGMTFFLVLGAIPYVSAYRIAGNPVFPFYNAYFKSPFYPPVNFDNPLFRSGVAWDLPYQIVFASHKYMEATAGASGFQWLLLLLPSIVVPLLLNNRRAGLLLMIGAISLVTVFHFQSYLRYVFPVLLLLSALAGLALVQIEMFGTLPALGMVIAASASIGLNLVFISAGAWIYRDMPVMAVFNPSGRDRFLFDRLPIRRAVELVNVLNSTRAPVAFFASPFGAGLTADALYSSWYNQEFYWSVEAAHDAPSLAKVLADHRSSIVILESTWGSAAQRDIVVAATRLVADFGPVSVRMLKKEFRFSRELLINPGLSGTQGWTLLPGAAQPEGVSSVVVTVRSPAAQTVPVQGGRAYLNTVRARCKDTRAQGRVQVNWLDSGAGFISASIQPFDCTSEWSEHAQEITAPEQAAAAVVYAVSNSDLAIEVDSVSMKAD